MPDPHIQFWAIVMEMIKGFVAAILGWIIYDRRKQGNRMAKLEAESIKREEYNNTMEALRKDIKESAKSTHERLDKLYLHMSERK